MWIAGDNGGVGLWDKRDGFSVGRWGFWKERFGEICREEGASEEMRRKAGEAAGRMMEIERVEGE